MKWPEEIFSFSSLGPYRYIRIIALSLVNQMGTVVTRQIPSSESGHLDTGPELYLVAKVTR